MDKDTSEIAKLTERISKDPKSKLFVPLAEEYKKTGDIEMSIHVLTEGLKNNPGYVTARSFLGRLLIEQGDLPGAQKEFEEVVKAIPDNLMAQRKLGDLYALQDRPADALNHYKIVMSLNPNDLETALLVTDAEAGRDIKTRLTKPKPSATGEPQKKQEPTQTVSAQAAAKSHPQPAPLTAAQPEPVQTPAAATEEEEPEEVLMVEPLEPVAPAGLDR
jgi:tetratricopeptide (TPR) repeat protein